MYRTLFVGSLFLVRYFAVFVVHNPDDLGCGNDSDVEVEVVIVAEQHVHENVQEKVWVYSVALPLVVLFGWASFDGRDGDL